MKLCESDVNNWPLNTPTGGRLYDDGRRVSAKDPVTGNYPGGGKNYVTNLAHAKEHGLGRGCCQGVRGGV